MEETLKPVILAFPLRGEWLAPNTPGKKIPSHGTNHLGERYAYDFLQVDWDRRGWPFYRVHWLHYLLFGVPLNKCYCWGQDVHAPCDGVIVEVRDGHKERPRAHLISDYLTALKNAFAFNSGKYTIQAISGNSIIMKCGNTVYAGLAHLQTGSIKVSAGQSVKKGDVLAKVGHSGNSFAPHLHFQLMDSSDAASSNGIPCAFEHYDLFQNGRWKKVCNGIPSDKDRIRFVKDSDTYGI